MAKKKRSAFVKILIGLTILIALAGGIAIYIGYRILYMPNTTDEIKKSKVIFLPTGSNFEDVMDTLRSNNILKHERSFLWQADLKKYKNKIRPGRYRILEDMTSNEIINLLRAGLQEPVNVTFNNVRTKEQLISRVCKKLEADSVKLAALLNSEQFLREKLGLKNETVLSLFIPNTYKFNWNTSAEQFIERMQIEYKKFWSEERKQKAKALNLTQSDVATLASVVQSEQMQFPEERPVIAGLYLNRLRIGMPLQSDPTIIYAIGDYTINRVLDKDKEVVSPYNTYLHSGLPPGPICIPEISSIDAVLNSQKSGYLYMCAKEDFSGKHNFAKTLYDHSCNALKYRRALNKSNIMR